LGAPVTDTVPVTVPLLEHCEELELPELLEQHMLELLLDPELLVPTHESDPTMRLARDVSPKPDAICGRTVTNKTKLAAVMIAVRARGFQLFIATSRSLPSSGHGRMTIPVSEGACSDVGPSGHGAARADRSRRGVSRPFTA
jgi:hypothetical protein